MKASYWSCKTPAKTKVKNVELSFYGAIEIFFFS